MKITKEELKELNEKGEVEVWTTFGVKEFWDKIEVEK